MPTFMIIYLCILTVGVTIGALNFNKLAKSSRYFWLLLVATLVTETLALISASIYNTNFTVYRIFAFIQYGLLARAYQMELTSYNRSIWISIVVVFIFGLIDTFINISLLHTQYHTLLKTLINLLIIALSLLYLRRMLITEMTYSFTDYPLFWLSIGWLVFSAITLFNFSALNFINQNAKNFEYLFQQIRIISNYVLYGMFIIAFVSKQRSLSSI